MKKLIFIFTLIFITIICLSACKDDENPVIPEAAPTFTVFSQTENWGGDLVLLFYARCKDCDINLIKVTITNPANQSLTYNAGNNLYVKDQNFALQETGYGYYKLSGPWKFKFEGNKAAGSKMSFSVEVEHTVAGKAQF